MNTINQDSSILVILTGGRIDSVWDSGVDEIIVGKHSIIPEYIGKLKIQGVQFAEVCMKDSRALTSDDRAKMLKLIQESPADKILITHGTHTLADTVEYLKKNLKSNSKTIVLTGSSIPLKDFAFSDAPFNLGYALAKSEDLPAGIYFCTNKKVIPADQII